MKTKFFWTIVMAFALTCTLAISAGAQDDHQRDDQNRQVDQNHDTNRADNGQWQNQNGWDSRTYERDQQPEGWSKGRKTKSSYCGGHDGCYAYNYQGSPYYYYRDDDHDRDQH